MWAYPDGYLRFADHRIRPGLDLLARIPTIDATQVVDLGSGPGDLTARLAERWPSASVRGIDSSAEMLQLAARRHPELAWTLADVAVWEPACPPDVIFSNAALHWIDDHRTLFLRLRSLLSPGGVIAVQMPDNWDAPTHRIPAEILDSGDWPPHARTALMRDRLVEPAAYARWLQPASVDMWHTTYYHQLSDEDAVWAWVAGSLLRPVITCLDERDRDRFATLCRERYAAAYPPDRDGVTLPFRRFFMVART